MISAIISRIVILLFGKLYPAYASYKAVRTKNVKEYVKWMMYWIVFAFFSFFETITDIFLSWFPFYYEVKVILVLWLLSPATKGSSTLYRKFVHPMLTRREQDIDEYISQAKEKGYTAVLQLGSKGVNYATNVIMQTAIKGGGNLVQTLRKSYSLSDLSEPDVLRTEDEVDEIIRPSNPRVLRSRTQSTRSVSGGRNDMYFPEVDVAKPRETHGDYSYIRSSEDISSGYSSAEPMSTGLSRTASLTNTTRARVKPKKTEETIFNEGREMESISNLPYPYLLYHNSNYYPITSESDEIFFFKENQKNLAKQLEGERGEVDTLNSIEEMKDEEFFANEKYFAETKTKNLETEDDKFQDTISIDSSEDEFLETETEELPIINKNEVVVPNIPALKKEDILPEVMKTEANELPILTVEQSPVVLLNAQNVIKAETLKKEEVPAVILNPQNKTEIDKLMVLKNEETPTYLFKVPPKNIDMIIPITEIPVSSTSVSLTVKNTNLTSSRNSLISLQGSSSDLTKRPISHRKGKAPPPPPLSPSPTPSSPIIFDSFKETSI